MVTKPYKENKYILITRPINASQKTMTWLLSKGYQVFHQPLSLIEPCPFKLPDNIKQFDALCASSAAAFVPFSQNNKLQKTIDPKLNFIQKLPLFCVGQKTAHAAQAAGFTNNTTISKNATDLVRKIILSPYNHFLYLAGKQRLLILEESLLSKNYHIDIIETYDRKAITPNNQETDKWPIFNAILLYSTIGLNGLQTMHKHFDKNTQFLCLSKRIAQTLPQEYQTQALIAIDPNEESLFKLL